MTMYVKMLSLPIIPGCLWSLKAFLSILHTHEDKSCSKLDQTLLTERKMKATQRMGHFTE